MKKIIYTFSFLVAVGFSLHTYATNPTPPASDKHEFKSTDREINFDIERKQGEVALYFQSDVFNSFDEILVERSGADNGNYSVCKTIEVNQVKISDNYYKSSDKYPMTSQKDCYYRIKTVGKDGSMKTFPPVLLAATPK